MSTKSIAIQDRSSGDKLSPRLDIELTTSLIVGGHSPRETSLPSITTRPPLRPRGCRMSS